MHDEADRREIFIEIVRFGETMKVTALDPLTGREASAIGPPHARKDLEKLAIGKLRRALGEGDFAPAQARPGKLV